MWKFDRFRTKFRPMKLAIALTSFLFPLLVSTVAEGKDPIFTDRFEAKTKVPERRALRGDWQIGDGVAKVTQDDELYKKYKDHGPILFYDVATTDATFRYAFKPEGCKTVVFTINGDGHVFRFVTSERSTSVRAFPASGDQKSISTSQQNDWTLKDGVWTEVLVEVAGDKVSVTYGDHEPITIEHETYANEKTNFSIGNSFGTLSVKGVVVE